MLKGGGVKIPVLNKFEISDKEKYKVIITILNKEVRDEAEKKIKQEGFQIDTIENLISQNDDQVGKNRSYIALFHEETMDDYYKEAETEESLSVFWDKSSVFFNMFQQLDVEKVVELACGKGRHVFNYIKHSDEVMLVDILNQNINDCRKRFHSFSKVDYYVNNGYDLSKLKDNYYTALFTYDAMVHFEMIDIYYYLKETYRVLKKGGRALFHHSNNHSDYRTTFSSGEGGRNFMSMKLFAYLAHRAGLIIIDQQKVDWAFPESDGVTLVEKR